MPVKNKLRTEVTIVWERVPRVTGRVMRLDTQVVTSPKGNEEVPYMLVDTKDRYARVYKSAALEEAFACVKVGDMVDIESIGMRDTKAGRQCRQFDVRVWEDTDLPPVEEAKVTSRRGPLAEEDVATPGAKRAPATRKGR